MNSNNGDPTIKKRPLESPSESNKTSKLESENENTQEPENKKVRMDQPPSAASSPPTKKRLIKVIPPKEPSASPNATASLSKGPFSSPSITLKLNPNSATSKPSSPKKTSIVESSAVINGSNNATLTSKTDNETATIGKDAAKEKEKLNSKDRILSKMQLDFDKASVLPMIEEARKEGKPVVVTDARLTNQSHPNFNISLGKNSFLNLILK